MVGDDLVPRDPELDRAIDGLGVRELQRDGVRLVADEPELGGLLTGKCVGLQAEDELP